MNWKTIIIFFITTFVGYFLSQWIAQFISWITPQYFNIDPNFFIILFSKKPSLSSTSLGYIIYATAALAMFTLSSTLTGLMKPHK
tara:strand:+ start:172 stop:426 length:255 start_codon:yes stop_codon:yes gene_type:complete